MNVGGGTNEDADPARVIRREYAQVQLCFDDDE